MIGDGIGLASLNLSMITVYKNCDGKWKRLGIGNDMSVNLVSHSTSLLLLLLLLLKIIVDAPLCRRVNDESQERTVT